MPKHHALIGREFEILTIRACLKASRNVLIEGPVGVGKTALALEIARQLGSHTVRVDGDGRFNEQKLTGWFDPPLVLEKGFSQDAFIAGPLIEAMQKGAILFINELNRLPEGVQNLLLPAIDERMVAIPKLGIVEAQPGFAVVATQNPKEFVATTQLSEAILDRFELVVLDYQTKDDESDIVRAYAPKSTFVDRAVALVRATREDRRFRRGASVRAAISVAEVADELRKEGMAADQAFLNAAWMCLPTRIELDQESEAGAGMDRAERLKKLIRELVEGLGHVTVSSSGDEKKK
ncbi:MAG: AAA family ATPase [Bacteriovoracia bacterium]